MQDMQQLNTLCFLETTDLKLLQQILKDLFAMKAKPACPSGWAFGKEQSQGLSKSG